MVISDCPTDFYTLYSTWWVCVVPDSFPYLLSNNCCSYFMLYIIARVHAGREIASNFNACTQLSPLQLLPYMEGGSGLIIILLYT